LHVQFLLHIFLLSLFDKAWSQVLMYLITIRVVVMVVVVMMAYPVPGGNKWGTWLSRQGE
jgi:hypothetical protein